MLILPAEKRAKFFVDDLDDLLGRRKRFQHIGTGGALRDAGCKLLYDLVADVRLQKCQAHLAHGFLHVRLRQPALAAQALEYIIQFIGNTLKCHNDPSLLHF